MKNEILASSQQKPLYEDIETTLTDDVCHIIANNDLRPKGVHPRFPHIKYAVDYGYLKKHRFYGW